ncbi:MAG: cupin domain-containing protein [Rhodospirillaceae bacterium]|jgi:mannose-6-phosphate isomerase-like protein (cupin superfamily)
MATEVDVKAPWWAVIGPDEGESIWQPEPSQGYVTVNLTPENTPYDGFSSGIQVLPPGCHVREHGHLQNHELIFIYEGTGRCEIEDEVYDIGPGSTVMFGRHAKHLLENTGDVDMKLFWVFMPPGLEDWFRAIGKVRTPGEPMPDKFSRPDDVMDVMKAMKFVPPSANAK